MILKIIYLYYVVNDQNKNKLNDHECRIFEPAK